jgi:hypothetical protein
MFPLVRMHAAPANWAAGAIVDFGALPVGSELPPADETSEALLALSGATITVECFGMASRAHDVLNLRI